jgi:chromosome segregation protein
VDNYTINKRSDNKIATINQIDDLIIKLRTIEEIDPEIVREAKESTERIEFLKTQQLDLQNAIRDTQKLIESLQKDIKKQFEESFKKINISFDKYFNTLFKGGSASLELESVEEDYGIEIKVSPPGKRSKNINTLSGGEKALAAIALLSAIIINNPSPFIVLDEVDAALDDENSMQFTKVLNELSGHCQVILITHNQETMQTAKNLFGITNSKNGITEILSLQLNEAKEHATA